MKDPNIYIPNLLGLTFGLAQVGLKVIYGNGYTYGKGNFDRTGSIDSDEEEEEEEDTTTTELV